MAVHENGVRTELVSRAQRHGGMDAKSSRLVGCRRNNAALIALAADHDGFSSQSRIEQLLHRHEERVHVEVEDSLQCRSWHDTTRGIPARSEVSWIFSKSFSNSSLTRSLLL